jgi:hypothetical protein
VLDEGDDEELGFEFVPPPPPMGHPLPSVAWDGLPAIAKDGFRVTEAAAYQLAQMKARADAEPTSAYGIFWSGVEQVLKGLSDSDHLVTAQYNDSSARVSQMPRSRLGRARFFFLSVPRKKMVTLLIIAQWREDDAWEAIERVRDRLRSSEWDTVFEELNAFVRPTQRGRDALIQATADAFEKSPSRDLEELKSRLNSAKPYEPVMIDDLKEAFAAVSEDAEDLIDNEDADRALAESSERIPWDQVQKDLEH